MGERTVLVLDVGKTNTKATLWSEAGELLDGRMRANASVQHEGRAVLDAAGVETFLKSCLTDFSKRGHIHAIIPVAHGAAAAFIESDQLAAPPTCYEESPSLETAQDYAAMRDPFAATGSPSLPAGLNLGAQLLDAERRTPHLASASIRILPYAQYWAWRLSGIEASEVTTLGCHSDLWRPYEARFSDLARRQGWSRRFAPLTPAGAVLGPVLKEWVDATGVNADCVVLCGAHDSNVAFYGVRANQALAGRDVSVVSTGTWFVAMRAPLPANAIDPRTLDPDRDVLMNVDVEGNPAPSARFMGGREVEKLIGGEDSPLRDPAFVHDVAPASIDEVLASGAMILPTFAAGVGPFSSGTGRWDGPALEGAARRAAVGLYLALVTDASLNLIGARDAIVVEGRFAADASFLGMLASLRPDCDVYAAEAGDGLSCGALRLALGEFTPRSTLTKIQPLRQDIAAYAARWRAMASRTEAAA